MGLKRQNSKGRTFGLIVLEIILTLGLAYPNRLRIVTEVQPSDNLLIIGIRGKRTIDTISTKAYSLYNREYKNIDSFVYVNCDTAILVIRTCDSTTANCLITKGLDDVQRYQFWLRTICGRPKVHKKANTIWCGCKYKITSSHAVSICVLSNAFHPKIK
ncbi:MAG: hypothetical protein GXO48_04480 [Chlorobi bacterium]|nr:hypothetical protein [Chlorobiota bacterium]